MLSYATAEQNRREGPDVERDFGGNLMNKPDEIAREQDYFDRARDEQQRSLEEFDGSARAGANTKASGQLKQSAKARRQAIDLTRAVAEMSFQLDDGDTYYVGRHAVFDRNSNLLVIPWQSPKASSFFEATAQEPNGVHRSRRFQTTHNRIEDFDDTVFADLLQRIESLEQPEASLDDALLRDLERQRTGEMRDIVKTIQSAQSQLIREPLNQLTVIQGGPGTGKTAIALHRISYLLFNHEELRDQDVLVVGPSPTFSRYIRDLLPDLGNVDVVQKSLADLGPITSNGLLEDESVAGLKGDARMAGLLTRGLAARIRVPSDENDEFRVATRAGTVSIPNSDVIRAIGLARRQPNYAEGRTALRATLRSEIGTRSSGTLEASTQEIDAAVDRIWPSLTPASFLSDLLGSRDRLLEAAGADFNAQEVWSLYRRSADRISQENWSDSDVPLLDEANALINGGARESFLHVVVDEAQDLSPMQMRCLARRSNGSMTVVGDIGQSTGPFARDSWVDVIDGLRQQMPVVERELEYGYRVPRQIMEFAQQLLPVAASGVSAPRVIRDGPSDPELLQDDIDTHAEYSVDVAREYAGRGLSVGVIIPPSLHADLVDEMTLQGVQWREASSGLLGQGINLLSAAESKGLEFDAVVVVSPERIASEDPNGPRLLYIAYTRTTKFLTVVHGGNPLAIDGLDVGQVISAVDADRIESPAEEDTNESDQIGRSAEQPKRGIQRAVVNAVVDEIVTEIQESVPDELWEDVLEQLHLRIGSKSRNSKD